MLHTSSFTSSTRQHCCLQQFSVTKWMPGTNRLSSTVTLSHTCYIALWVLQPFLWLTISFLVHCRVLESQYGIHCNLTLLFSFCQVEHSAHMCIMTWSRRRVLLIHVHALLELLLYMYSSIVACSGNSVITIIVVNAFYHLFTPVGLLVWHNTYWYMYQVLITTCYRAMLTRLCQTAWYMLLSFSCAGSVMCWGRCDPHLTFCGSYLWLVCQEHWQEVLRTTGWSW